MTSPGGPRLVPAYLATGEHAQHAEQRTGTPLGRMSLLVHTEAPRAEEFPSLAHQRLYDLLEPGALALVECAAHLGLPVSVTRLLTADLVEDGLLHARAPAERVDRTLLERLRDGLKSLDP